MTPPDDDASGLLLQAYVDGELDASSILALERRLEVEPELATARDRLLALRRLLRRSPLREAAPDGLRRSMAACAEGQSGGVIPFSPKARLIGRLTRMNRGDWGMALAACLFGVLSGAALTTVVLHLPPSRSPVMAEVVADHLRAVMAPQPFDVASSDQHTVKPWFTGRLPFAPEVFDLAQVGFPLIGGRVDVLSGQAAATLVFRHDKHLISLMSQPAERTVSLSHGGEEERGFQVRDWVIGGMHYWAVSDVASDELDAFETAVKAQLRSAG